MSRDLVIVEPDLEIGLEQNKLVLRRQGKVIRHCRLQDLDQLILMGRQELTAAARHKLLQSGIEVVMMTAKGRYLGRMGNHLSRNGPLRLAQYKTCSQPESALELAKSCIRGKINNQRRLLLQRQRRVESDKITQALADMRRMLVQLDQATGIESLMGHEGHAAARYFAVLPELIQVTGFEMQGRSRRPPRDRVNAALSFGYTILTNLLETCVLRAGLDPYLGFLHQARHGLPALVLDLVEEFRPVLVDSLILSLINRGQLQTGDFYQPQDAELATEILTRESEDPLPAAEPDPRPAVYLNETGRRIFFQAWYERLNSTVLYTPLNKQFSFRDIVQHQVWHLARVLMDEDPHYLPFVQR